MDLSIIVVNYNTQRLLQQYLQSVYETVTDLSFETFVVDNASSDGTIKMVQIEFPQVQLICNSVGLGFARAANLALARAKGSYFLICHPDVKLLPDTVQEMYSFLQTHPGVGIVGANLLYPDGGYNRCAYKKHSLGYELLEFTYPTLRNPLKILPRLKRKIDQLYARYYWDHQTTAESARIWNACMMFRREVLETVGDFYEGFYVWFADTDWCYRAKNAGWRLYYLAEARAIHYERQSVNYIDSRQVAYKVKATLALTDFNKDHYLLLKRHYGPGFLWLRKGLDTALLLKLALLQFNALLQGYKH